jgi:hypothetical protein
MNFEEEINILVQNVCHYFITGKHLGVGEGNSQGSRTGNLKCLTD